MTHTTIVSVIIPADHSHTGEAHRCEKPIDNAVAVIVERLNHPTFGEEPITTGCGARCGGLPPSVSLVDGREMLLASGAYEAAVWALASGHECPLVDVLGQSTTRARRFHLVRHQDPTGVSGTGLVAKGWNLANGVAVVRWQGEYGTTTVHHKGMIGVEAIHCHNGATSIVWPDHYDVPVPDLGIKLVYRTDGTPYGQPGWVISLDSVDGDPERWSSELDEGGPQSQNLRHGDHLLAVGDVYLQSESAGRLWSLLHSSERKLAATEIQVGRCTPSTGGDPAAITIKLRQ
jgi:hypothetical protein